MRIQLQKRNEGQVLIIAIIFTVLIGMSLGSYLLLARSQGMSVRRSQSWNGALNLAEAGVEEALQQINTSPNNFAANSWGGSGGVYGPKTGTLLSGSYSVMIRQSGYVATIYSTGAVTAPLSSGTIRRAIKVTATDQPWFSVGIGTVSNITMNGNGIAVNSWNSHSNNLSNNGAYDPTKTSTNGNIASEYGFVNLGNHTVQGNLYLGADAQYKTNSGTVTGTIYDDYNVHFPDVTLPNVNWTLAVPSAVVTSSTDKKGNVSYVTNYVYDFKAAGNTTNYIITQNLPIQVQTNVTVTLDVKVTDFTGTINVLGGMNNSGTLIMYQESGSIALAGNDALGAIASRPENFIYFGMPGVTSITFSGNSSFVGAIYAPEATFKLNGGGNNSYDIMGAVIAKSMTVDGHFSVHYDEALAELKDGRGYTPTSWQEL